MHRLPTKAQIWARYRNGKKFLLLGLSQQLLSMSLDLVYTREEQKHLAKAHTHIKAVLLNWKARNVRSKEIFISALK